LRLATQDAAILDRSLATAGLAPDVRVISYLAVTDGIE